MHMRCVQYGLILLFMAGCVGGVSSVCAEEKTGETVAATLSAQAVPTADDFSGNTRIAEGSDTAVSTAGNPIQSSDVDDAIAGSAPASKALSDGIDSKESKKGPPPSEKTSTSAPDLGVAPSGKGASQAQVSPSPLATTPPARSTPDVSKAPIVSPTPVSQSTTQNDSAKGGGPEPATTNMTETPATERVTGAMISDVPLLCRVNPDLLSTVIRQWPANTPFRVLRKDDTAHFAWVSGPDEGQSCWVNARFLKPAPEGEVSPSQISRENFVTRMLHRTGRWVGTRYERMTRYFIGADESAAEAVGNGVAAVLAPGPVIVEESNDPNLVVLQAIQKENTKLRMSLLALETEHAVLLSDLERDWFFRGAKVFFLGLLVGLVIGFVAGRRRSSQGWRAR